MKTIFILLLLVSSTGFLQGQTNDFKTGLVFDDEQYRKNPVAARLSKGEYDNLPRAVSLKPYAPTPGNQGKTGTCTAWSTAFHAYTIAESIKLGRTRIDETDQETFSPSFIYNQIRSVNGCEEGTQIDKALTIMKSYGNLKFSSFPFNCDKPVYTTDRIKASDYKIYDYRILFDIGSNQKLLPVKKALSEKNPVVIGMACCVPSFYKMTFSGIWTPTTTEKNTILDGGHAMTIIGYDDDLNGGSFELINSWGTSWGDEGYFWIKYPDFIDFVRYAYEMILMPPLVVDLNGEVDFKLLSGETMEASFDADDGIYKMSKPYSSGTQFRFYMNNSQPAYVYALGSDLSNRSFRIFPVADTISAYLGYSSNQVAIPDEDHYVFMDTNTGKDYFCILYSKLKLDLTSILARLELVPGDFKTRLGLVLEQDLIDAKRIDYNSNAISFEAKSGDQSIVPIIIEIVHN